MKMEYFLRIKITTKLQQNQILVGVKHFINLRNRWDIFSPKYKCFTLIQETRFSNMQMLSKNANIIYSNTCNDKKLNGK